MKPRVYDFYCGLGGWTEAFLAEGYDAVGFDIERHDYGNGGYPGQLVLQDVCTIHGAQLVDAAALVSSSPCQEFSYRAMPWKRAKALGPPVLGINLFWQPFRIQQEIFEACGRWVPLVAENVKGAQPWIGRARWHYGSFYLWGDVPALMPSAHHRKVPGMNFHEHEKTGQPGRSFQSAAVDSIKNEGGSWFNIGSPGQKTVGQNPDGRKTVGHVNKRDGHTHTRHLTNQRESDAVKQAGLSGPAWFDKGAASFGSASLSRKAASAQIAKIPFPLAQHIARVYKPEAEACA